MPNQVQKLWEEYAPRIAEAQKKDTQAKEQIFLPWFEERIADQPAVQLTPQRYLLLTVSSALIGEKDPTFDSVLRFLWIVSPKFSESKTRARFFQWHKRKLDPEKTTEACAKYLERAFTFQPSSKANAATSGGGDWVSGLVDTIASEYGWPLPQIMKTPLPILFLLCARIKARFSGKAINFSSEADRLKSEYLQKVNDVGGAA